MNCVQIPGFRPIYLWPPLYRTVRVQITRAEQIAYLTAVLVQAGGLTKLFWHMVRSLRKSAPDSSRAPSYEKSHSYPHQKSPGTAEKLYRGRHAAPACLFCKFQIRTVPYHSLFCLNLLPFSEHAQVTSVFALVPDLPSTPRPIITRSTCGKRAPELLIITHGKQIAIVADRMLTHCEQLAKYSRCGSPL